MKFENSKNEDIINLFKHYQSILKNMKNNEEDKTTFAIVSIILVEIADEINKRNLTINL